MSDSPRKYPDVEANPDFPKIEERILGFWQKDHTFQASIDHRPADKGGQSNEFIFYDGPPFANGLPHYGHLLTGFVKDVFARYQTMRGRRVERRFGWDCHGLPAEMGAEKDLGIHGRQAIMQYGIDKFNDYCRTSVMKYTREWESYVTRQARWVDFTHDYKTMDKSYMESVIWAFSELYKKGLIYEAYRVMPYSWAAETPLSASETRLDNSYRERVDKAVTVAFELKEKPKGAPDAEKYYVLAWTTTPWTLPSNLALAVNKGLEYVGFSCAKDVFHLGLSTTAYYIASANAAKHLGKVFGYPKDEVDIDFSINGSDVIGLTYTPLFPYFKDHPNSFRILDGSDFVTDTDGTGIVHMAPGFGEDDQRVCEANGITLVCPVDDAGRFTNEIFDIDYNGEPLDSPPRKRGGPGGGEFTSRDPQSLEYAREMRKHPTDAEHKLWYYLQKEQLEGCKFRRQHPVGAYITDFCCLEKKLIVEIDGSQHGEPDHSDYDAKRTEFLERAGFRVLRFWNNEVLQQTDGVREAIAQELRKEVAPTLPSPASGGGNDRLRASGGGIERLRVSGEAEGRFSLRGKNVLEENIERYKFGEVNELIIDYLKKHGTLIKQEQITHNYPHCWRTDKPLIYRAVSSWYVEVTKFRSRMVELNQQINWIPEHTRDGLFGKWLENARDWSISRNRFWGTPIPVWRSDNPANKELYVMGSFAELEAFFGKKVVDLHRPYIDDMTKADPLDPKYTIRRVKEVFDCWFESGSMPYAQVHYPFENRDWFEHHFPADFIVEYVAQTRGWFYNMMVLSTALFDKPPFKNCICHGVVLDDKGQKLSKRLNNSVDPTILFEQYGADALRWFMMSSPVMRGQELYIDKEGKFIRDEVRLAIKPIWNAYNFFCLYANADGVTGHYSNPSSNDLDRYILAKCARAVKDIAKALDAYDTNAATEAVSQFFEALNNWYIRRNKERFWKEEKDEDKQAAYDTLYTVLHTMCRAAAPLLPLTLEEIYRSLTGEESVHLADFPDVSAWEVNDLLFEDMEAVRSICNSALALRNARNLRVRLPLASLKVVSASPKYQAALAAFGHLIADEVNVKETSFESDISLYAFQKLQIHFPVLGKRLPEKMKQIIPASKKGHWKLREDGRIEIAGEVLEKTEFALLLEPKSEYKDSAQSLSDNDGLVVLDIHVTADLESEGYARDLVRLIQQARKDAGLQVTDRIHLRLRVSENLSEALNRHQDYIASQVLAASLSIGDMQGCSYIVNETIENEEVSIGFAGKAIAA